MMYLPDKILYLRKGLYSKNAYKSIESISRRTTAERYILIEKEESRYIVMILKQ